MTRTADVVLTGAPVYTMDAARSWSDALAIGGGRIIAVGADAAEAVTGAATLVVELDGGMVVPGFQDAHAHPLHGGLAQTQCDLHDVFGADAYERAIVEYARAHPDLEWIVGRGWAMDAFPGGAPERAALDRATGDRPACFTSRDGHSVWVNRRALELAGVSRSTPDPKDGRIERDARGEPAGTLHEGAMDLVLEVVPAATVGELVDALRRGQAYMHSLGITSWNEAMVDADALAAYRDFARSGELTARVVLSLLWDRDRGEEQLDWLSDARATGTLGRARATNVKIFQDGIVESFTAGMLEPYLDADGGVTGNSGLSMIEPGALENYVTVLDRAGFQVHFHAIGDRAVREALDAVEAARRSNGARDARHHIAHIQVVHPEDVPRFRALGVVANAQPFWACYEPQMLDLTIPFLGAARAQLQYPFASLMRSGAALAFGSDWPISTPDPLLEIEVATTRVAPENRTEAPFLPDERLDLRDALAAATIGSAYVAHAERDTGTLEVGKYADVAVLDRDLFAPHAGPVGEARVELTFVDGEVVYDGRA